MKYYSLLLVLSLALGCNRTPEAVELRAKSTGIPIATQSSLTRIMENGEKNSGLTDSEWSELESLVLSEDPKVRHEAVTALGGISAKRTTQGERIVKFLETRATDPSEDVRKRAELIKGFHLEALKRGVPK